MNPTPRNFSKNSSDSETPLVPYLAKINSLSDFFGLVSHRSLVSTLPSTWKVSRFCAHSWKVQERCVIWLPGYHGLGSGRPMCPPWYRQFNKKFRSKYIIRFPFRRSNLSKKIIDNSGESSYWQSKSKPAVDKNTANPRSIDPEHMPWYWHHVFVIHL